MKLIASFAFLSGTTAFLCPRSEWHGSFVEKRRNSQVVDILSIDSRSRSATVHVPAFPLKASTESPLDLSGTDDFPGDIERDELLDELEALTEAFESVQSNVQTNTKLYESKLDEYESEIAMLKEEVQKQLASVIMRDNDIKELKAIIESTKQNASEMEDAIVKEGEEIIANLQKELDELEDTLQKKDAEVNILKGILVGKDNEIETKAKELDDDTTKIALEERIQELEDILKEKETLESELKSSQEAVINVQNLMEGKDEETAELKSSMETLRTEIEELQADRKRLEGEIEDTWNSLSFKEKAWSEEKEKLIRRQGSLSEEIEKLTKSAETLNTEKGELMKTKYTLTTEKNKIHEENNALRAELSESRAASETKQNDLLKKIEELEYRLNGNGDTKLRKDIIDIKAQSQTKIMDLQLQMDSVKSSADMEVDAMRSQIESYEAERNSLRKLTALGLKRVVSPLRRKKGKKDATEGADDNVPVENQ